MKCYIWKIYEGQSYIGSGKLEAESEREAITKVLELPHKVEADKCYSVTVGDSCMSSYGDEFTRSADVTGWGEDGKIEEGHMFPTPKLSDVGIDVSEAIDGCKDAFENLSEAAKKAVSAFGYAMRNAKEGEELEVRLHDSSIVVFIAGQDIVIGASLRKHGGTVWPIWLVNPGDVVKTGGTVPPSGIQCVTPGELCPVTNQPHSMNDDIQVPLSGKHARCVDCRQVSPDPIAHPNFVASTDEFISRSNGVDWTYSVERDDPLSFTITNGVWRDGFTRSQQRIIQQRVNKAGMRSQVIQNAVRMPSTAFDDLSLWLDHLENGQ